MALALGPGPPIVPAVPSPSFSLFRGGALVGGTALLLFMAQLAMAVPAADEARIDDDAIVAHVEAEGNALIKSGKSTRLKTLRLQLPRVHTCALDLAPAETADLPPSEMYARRARGVVVVGVLAKQKKRAKYELAGCSGFALTADGVLVTNYHVVDNPEGETLVVMTREGQVTPITEVLAADSTLR